MTEHETPTAEDDGYGRATPLAVHVQRKVRFAERATGGELPPWDEAVFGERGHGPRALPWDGWFRRLDEFEPRWNAILEATTRDWVNLDLAGVRDRRLIFIVEYMTDDHVKRTWPSESISINGGVGGGLAEDPLFLNATW